MTVSDVSNVSLEVNTAPLRWQGAGEVGDCRGGGRGQGREGELRLEQGRKGG